MADHLVRSRPTCEVECCSPGRPAVSAPCELENVIERAVILSQGPHVDPSGWPPPPGVSPRGGGIRTLEELEREHIVAVPAVTGWRVSGRRGAATLLGLKPTTLEARMKRLGIRRP